MADAREIVCEVCGFANPPTAADCGQCGVELKAGKKGADVERLLEELIQAPSDKDREKSDDEALDLDKEIVDELLDSLLVGTRPGETEAESGEGTEAPEAPATVDVFECPMCGATVSADASVCPSCGTRFAEPGEIVGAGPAAHVGGATGPESREAPSGPAVAVSEADASKVSALSGRLIDLVVFGTIGALFAVFLYFGMYSWGAVATNPLSLITFFGVAVGGFGAGLVLFRVSTSAIAHADRLVKEGRYEEAIALYDRAIRMGSKPATAWTSKGVAFKRMGRLDEAIRCHNAALKLNPKNEIAWCNKGDILFRAGRLEKAIEAFDKAIEIRPKYAIAWNNKGAALARAGRYEDARRCHDRAVQLKPRYVAAWLNRGEVLARLGDREEAQRCLERARALGA